MSIPPILLIKRGSVSARDIALARKAGVLVVVVKDPADVRYMHPPLAPMSRFQALAMEMVRGALGKDRTIHVHDIKERLAQVFMEDTRPEQPKPIADNLCPPKPNA